MAHSHGTEDAGVRCVGERGQRVLVARADTLRWLQRLYIDGRRCSYVGTTSLNQCLFPIVKDEERRRM